MGKRNNNQFYGFLAVLITIAAFIGCWQLIIPKYKSNRQSLDTLTKEVAAAKQQEDSIKTASTSLSGLGAIVDQMMVAIPKDKDTANLISELEQIASKHNTYIPTIQVADSSTTQTGSSSDEVIISLSVSGAFADLQGFVKSIEGNLKYFNIQSLSLSAPAGGPMSLSLQIKAYKQIKLTTLSSEVPTTLPTGTE